MLALVLVLVLILILVLDEILPEVSPAEARRAWNPEVFDCDSPRAILRISSQVASHPGSRSTDPLSRRGAEDAEGIFWKTLGVLCASAVKFSNNFWKVCNYD